MVSALSTILLYAPTESVMGDTQRIFYFHVPAAVNTFISFFIVFVGSIQFLRTRKSYWDKLALSAAQVGILFCLIVLITGPLWAKPVWGVFWRWEPRLTTVLIMFSNYTAYLMLRRFENNSDRILRIASVIGIIAFLNVPLVYFAVDLWAADQQLHPQRGVDIDPKMRLTLYVSFIAHFCLLTYLILQRLHLHQIQETVSQLKNSVNNTINR
ncbi:MAG: cytochrome C assembly protein [Gemmatimonadetes bacterium]|jgi:heme exporter protein C|nr:cytochrome C assembly protein [Gemmatimonadota bacterium]